MVTSPPFLPCQPPLSTRWSSPARKRTHTPPQATPQASQGSTASACSTSVSQEPQHPPTPPTCYPPRQLSRLVHNTESHEKTVPTGGAREYCPSPHWTQDVCIPNRVSCCASSSPMAPMPTGVPRGEAELSGQEVGERHPPHRGRQRLPRKTRHGPCHTRHQTHPTSSVGT
jgi:hypothetical protein